MVAIEGDMSQNKREYSMMKFRKNQADVLVATDVAARGIDVPKVGLVVNYDVPNQDMVYFHRIGRTARAGAKGRAITLVSYSSIADWKIIKKQIKSDLTATNKPKVIESVFEPENMSSLEIDKKICDLSEKGEDIYKLVTQNVSNANPDLIISQELCEVMCSSVYFF